MTDRAHWLGLADRVCVVTGAGSGIGAETARRFAVAGARVAVLDRDAAAASAVADEIASSGGRAIALTADVAHADAIATAAARVLRELGPCHVLVNNAAARHRDNLIDIGIGDWNRLIAVNLTGALACTQAFAGQMIATGDGGSIVHVGSILGHNPQAGNGTYSVAKAGLMMMSRVLSLELAQHRVRSNVVSPGFTRTPANEDSYRNTATALVRERLVPVGRVAAPADLADVILFLASDRSGYIDGEDIIVDGGVTNTLMSQVPRFVDPRS
jgi:NAD(P)-dependent dehydrogenase (short-subunit alcohol dehydrogenase family)